MYRRSVRFARHTAKSPRDPESAELYVLKRFSQHIEACPKCHVLENELSYRCKLCARGKGYGEDVQAYLTYDGSRIISLVDEERGLGRTEVLVPTAYKSSSIFLKCKAAQRRHQPSTNGNQPMLPQLIHSTPLFIKPTVHIDEGSRPGELLLYVTIPNFTMPVKLAVPARPTVNNSRDGKMSRR